MSSAVPHSRPAVSTEAIEAVVAALRAGHLSDGSGVQALEAAIGSAYGGRAVAAVSSGTAALHLALRAAGVKPGDEVFIPSYTCNSVWAAVSLLGAIPVLLDSVDEGLNLSPHAARRRLTARTVAAVVPHLFGFEADVAAFRDLGLMVIEDCAHAPCCPGAGGQMLGTVADVAILSFFATKLIPAGEGGCVIARDPDVAERVRALRDCDQRAPLAGAFNLKLSDLHAALARTGFLNLRQEWRCRREAALRYDRALGPAALRRDAHLCEHRAAPFRYLLWMENRAVELIVAAERQGISCRHPVWQPLHWSLGGVCPRADRLHASLVSVPCYPTLSPTEEGRVCSAISAMLSSS